MKTKPEFRCPHCNSLKVQVQVWADPNTDRVVDWDAGTYDFCEDCGQEIEGRDRAKLWGVAAPDSE